MHLAKSKPFRTSLLRILLVLVVVPTSTSLANNNFFLPGDAFFPTELTKADLEALKAAPGATRTFKYSRFDGYDMAFCGYAGYFNASIPAVNDAFVAHLSEAYATVRKSDPRELSERTHNGKTELVETNGIRVLFYPATFDFQKYHLGLRYNENWAVEAVKFGHKRENLRLCSLIPDRAAIEISWRDADSVPALKAKLPNVRLQPVPAIEAPVIVDEPVKAIVIGSRSLKEIFKLRRNNHMVLHIVDAEGVVEWMHEDGKWKPSDSDEN